MGKWILLPVMFKGIWYSPKFGGFNVALRNRFNPELPPDRLYELLKETHPEIAMYKKPHDCAEPKWKSKEEFEAKYGKVEAIFVNEETWNNLKFFGTPDEDDLLIFTDKYVIAMDEYDGLEYFTALPRDYRQLLRGR
jgi:hypothetical protein